MPPGNRVGARASRRERSDAFSDKNLFFNSFLLPLLLAAEEEEKRRRRLLALQLARDPSSGVSEDEVALQLILGAGGRNPFSFLTGPPLQRERTTGSTLPGGTFTSVRGR